MAVRVHPIFLTDGGQKPEKTARALTAFCAKAERTIDVAIYNVMLDEDVARDLVRVLVAKARAGVRVRIAYDDTSSTEGAARGDGVDVKIPATKAWLRAHFAKSGVATRGIRGSSLMHDKYVVRDAGARRAAVWTGSANFTNDAWARQENVVLVIDEPAIAALYAKDFGELWNRRRIAGTGADADGGIARGRSRIDVAFSPGDGSAIERRIAELVAGARRRVLVASMVVSSLAILRALRTAERRGGVTVRGIVDHAQMSAVMACWRRAGAAGDPALAAWRAVRSRFVEKPSTPFDRRHPTALHDFMHDKLLVADDTVLTGSFNFSHHAATNAENIVLVTDPALAARFASYVRAVIATYAR